MKAQAIIDCIGDARDATVEVSNRDGMTCLYGVQLVWRPRNENDEYVGRDNWFEDHAMILGEEIFQDEHGSYRMLTKAGDFELPRDWPELEGDEELMEKERAFDADGYWRPTGKWIPKKFYSTLLFITK